MWRIFATLALGRMNSYKKRNAETMILYHRYSQRDLCIGYVLCRRFHEGVRGERWHTWRWQQREPSRRCRQPSPEGPSPTPNNPTHMRCSPLLLARRPPDTRDLHIFIYTQFKFKLTISDNSSDILILTYDLDIRFTNEAHAKIPYHSLKDKALHFEIRASK